jgi:hypothetical protein
MVRPGLHAVVPPRLPAQVSENKIVTQVLQVVAASQPQEIQKRGRGDVIAVPKSPGGPQADRVGGLKDTGGVQQLQRDNGSGFGGCVDVSDLGSKVERSKRLGHNRVTSLGMVFVSEQYLTPCFARGPERFFHVFLSRLLEHIAALFVRHLTSHPDPGTFHPEGERHLFRKALLWLTRGDLAVRKLRIEVKKTVLSTVYRIPWYNVPGMQDLGL